MFCSYLHLRGFSIEGFNRHYRNNHPFSKGQTLLCGERYIFISNISRCDIDYPAFSTENIPLQNFLLT